MRRKITILLSILLLILAIFVGIFLVGQRTSFFGLAAPTSIPQKVKITNISDNSFTVSWITEKKTKGFVSYGKTDKLGEAVNDDRDTNGQTERFTHHVTVGQLDPSAKYHFKIGSGSKGYDNNGIPFIQQTAPTTSSPPILPDPAYGKILGLSGVPVDGTLVYLTVAGGTPLSGFVSANGNWLITLSNARSSDLQNYISYKSTGDEISIFVESGQGSTATATTDTNNSRPVPNITLGNTYSFKKVGEQATPQATSSAQTSSAGFSLQAIDNVKESAPTPSPSLKPTVKPSASPRISMPSTESGVPVSGVADYTFALLVGGFIFLFSGAFLFAKER